MLERKTRATDPPARESDPAAANIPPAGRPDQAVEPSLRLPSRERIAAATVRVVRHGRRLKADLRLIDEGQGPIVIKDVAAKRWYLRWIGRLEVSREARAYRRLGPLPGVPHFVGRIDRDAIAVEWIDGTMLASAADRLAHGPLYVRRLREIMDRLHARGLAHLDLRSNKNVVVRDDGELFVVDFASAIRLRPGGLLHRLVFPLLRAHDVSGWLKWKKVLAAGPLSDDELRLLGRHRRLRPLWPFNPKHRIDNRRRRDIRRRAMR